MSSHKKHLQYSIVNPNAKTEKHARLVREAAVDEYTPQAQDYPVPFDYDREHKAYRKAPLAEDIRKLYGLDPFLVNSAPIVTFFMPYVMQDVHRFPCIVFEQHARLLQTSDWSEDTIASLDPARPLSGPLPDMRTCAQYISGFLCTGNSMLEGSGECYVKATVLGFEHEEYECIGINMEDMLPLFTVDPYEVDGCLRIHIAVSEPRLEINDEGHLYIAYRNIMRVYRRPSITKKAWRKHRRKIEQRRREIFGDFPAAHKAA